MALSFVAAGALIDSAGGTGLQNLSPAYPAGIANGDLLVCMLLVRSRTAVLNNTSGWTAWQTYAHASQDILFAVSFRYYGGEAAPTLGVASGGLTNGTMIAQICALRGFLGPVFALGNGTTGTQFSTSATAQNIGPITGITLQPKEVALICAAKMDDWTTNAIGTGDGLTFTAGLDAISTKGTDAGLKLTPAINNTASPVAMTSKTFTVTGGAVNHSIGVMIGLKIGSPSPAGTQPSGSGSLTAHKLVPPVTVTGVQPSASGILSMRRPVVAVDAVSSSGGGGAISLPHTCSGTNRLLLLFVADWTGGDASALSVNPQYDGVAMTLHGTHAFSTARVEVWSLVNPHAGTHNITYTNTGVEAVAGISFHGVDQTSPLPQVASVINGPNPPVSGSLTVPTTDLWVEGLCILCGNSPTPGAGFTQQVAIAPCNPKLIVATRSGTGGSLSDTWVTALSDGRWADLALRIAAVPVLTLATVAGTQPASTGTLSAFKQSSRSLTGTQPANPLRVADDFNRSNSGTLGTSSGGQTWTPANAGWSIASNQAVSNYAGGQPALALTDLGAKDGVVAVDLTEGPNEDPSVVVRANDSANYLLCAPWGLIKIIATSGTLLASFASRGNGVTHTYQVEFRGKRILITRSGAGVAVDYTLSDADYALLGTGTLVGLSETTSSHGSVDNFLGIADAGTLAKLQLVIRPLTGAQPASGGTLSRLKISTRALVGAQPFSLGTLTRQASSTRSLAGAQPSATGTLTRLKLTLSSLTGAQPFATGTLTRGVKTALRALTGAQPFATGLLARGVKTSARAVLGVQPFATGALARGIKTSARALTGAQPFCTGILTGLKVLLRSLTGAQSFATGTLSRKLQLLRVLAGLQPFATGLLTRQLGALRSLLGAQPFATGVLLRAQGRARSVIGTQPFATGSLTRQVVSASRSLLGAQPFATGTLLFQVGRQRALTGSQPFGIGTLLRRGLSFRTLNGLQPFASASLVRPSGVSTRALTGAQPFATGTLTFLAIKARFLAGTQPYATGAILRHLDAHRDLQGSQASSSATLLRGLVTARALVGIQVAPSGLLLRSHGVSCSLQGSQPFCTGTLASLAIRSRLVSGSQPFSHGTLLRQAFFLRSLSSSQPWALGQISRSQAGSIELEGVQPFATGRLAVLTPQLLQVYLGLRSPTQATQPAGTGASGSTGTSFSGRVGTGTIGGTGTGIQGKNGTGTEQW